MMIDINARRGIKVLKFPDGQPHVKVDPEIVDAWEPLNICVSLDSSDRVLELLMTVEAAKAYTGVTPYSLTIKYLMGARYDRRMVDGDSFDLKIIANLINSCKFSIVYIVDPHSDVATALIDNSVAISNKFLVDQYDKPRSVLIIPDGGAIKKASKYAEWNKNLNDEVLCIKHRDVSNGSLSIKVLEPNRCTDEHCVIIDDLCDGGGTFIGIAQQIKDYKPLSLTLIVTHGIFSKGVQILNGIFDQVITSDSYPHGFDSDNFLKIIPCPLNT